MFGRFLISNIIFSQNSNLVKKTVLLLPFLCLAISLKAQTATSKTTIDSLSAKKQIFTAVEVQPEFPGGEAALGRFLQYNIVYPPIDKKKNVQGKVYVQFVVERDGSLSDIKTLRSPSQTIADEIIRVLQLSPNWIPGKQDGKPVRVQFTLPVNFSLGK